MKPMARSPETLAAPVRASFPEKLKFVFRGIRYFDILVLMAYPTLGAALALEWRQ
jgi:hypothetical protein